MVPTERATSPSEDIEDRMEVHLHRAEAEQNRAVAAAMGASETDFIREATLRRAVDVEQRMSLTVLPQQRN